MEQDKSYFPILIRLSSGGAFMVITHPNRLPIGHGFTVVATNVVVD